MDKNKTYCLSIAGFDPCAGAGIPADIKTFEQHGVYGLVVCSCLTFQNDDEFSGLRWCTREEMEKQLNPLKKYPVKAVKIGLIENSERLEWLIGYIRQAFRDAFIIWDPVLKASAGFGFHRGTAFSSALLSRTDLVTPNAEEYRELGLSGYTQTPILLKGGHRTQQGTDVLFIKGTKIEIPGEAFGPSFSKHGTGCVLSSAIAANVAKGLDLAEACREAKKYVEKFMTSDSTKLGYHA